MPVARGAIDGVDEDAKLDIINRRKSLDYLLLILVVKFKRFVGSFVDFLVALCHFFL